MLKIAANGTETIPQTVSMKAKIKNTPEVDNEEKSLKDALTNPMETVGRSQVQFRGTLSSKDLNAIARNVSETKLNRVDIATFKEALSNTLKKYNMNGLQDAKRKLGNDMDKSIKFSLDIIGEATRINPDADLDKIGTVAASIF